MLSPPVRRGVPRVRGTMRVMATHTGTAVNVFNGTLTASAGDIDIITMSGGGESAQAGGGIPIGEHVRTVRIHNRHATVNLWFDFTTGGTDNAAATTALTNPSIGGAEIYFIPAASYLDVKVKGYGDAIFKLISGTSATANPYTIMILDS